MLQDKLPLRRIERRDRQAVATLQGAHSRQLRMSPQFADGDERYLPYQLHIYIEPARLFRRGLGVEVFAVAVELRRVGINAAADPGNARDAWLLAVGVVKQHAIADPHLVAHEVARLVVAHTIPCHRLAGHRSEIVDAAIGGFGFHQPVAQWCIPLLCWLIIPRKETRCKILASRRNNDCAGFPVLPCASL